MKKLFPFLLLSIFATTVYAQAPLFTKTIISERMKLSGGYIAATSPEDFTTVNNKLVFAARVYRYDSTTANLVSGKALMATDGTPGNVTDLLSVANEDISFYCDFNNELYFTRNDVLWKTNGTAAGTIMLADTNLKIENFGAPSFSALEYNSRLYFTATDGIHGYELWSTDGTAAGTSMLIDIMPGAESSSPLSYVIYNGKLYFDAVIDANNTDCLWETDGTAAGTKKIKEFLPFAAMAFPKVVNGKICFAGRGDTTGEEPWVSDGTEAGTYMLKDIAAGNKGSVFPNNNGENFFTSYNGKLYFTAGSRLWMTDGTIAGTDSVGVDIIPADNKFVHNGVMYMMGINDSTGQAQYGKEGLWESNGLKTGTKVVQYIPQVMQDARDNSGMPYFTEYRGELYFLASNTNATNKQLA